MRKTYLVIAVFFLNVMLFAQQNVVTGKIIDADTFEPIIGATIIILGLNATGTVSDLNGDYTLKVAVGSYSMKVSTVGYSTIIKTDVIVKSGRETQINIKLKPTAIDLREVTVKADYFDKALKDNLVSSISLGAEEIKRSPGNSQDFQRMIQALPGVSTSSDQSNELLVRGGAPNENLTVLDNMELHSTNHYPNPNNSGGPINMINADLIEDITFSAGGFLSKYGDKMSSAAFVTTREGRRNSGFYSDVNMNMAGIGGIFEGGINDGKGSWLISARKSYIDLIASGFGLTSVPDYYDIQGKIVYDFSSQHKLSISGIFGNDKINIKGSPADDRPLKAALRDTVNSDRVDVRSKQYAIGGTLRSLWSNNFYSLLTVYTSKYIWDLNVFDRFAEYVYDSKGAIKDNNTLKESHFYKLKSFIQDYTIKPEINWLANKTYELSAGAAIKFFGSEYLDEFPQDRIVRYRNHVSGLWEIVNVKAQSSLNSIDPFSEYKAYWYLNNKFKLFDEKMILNIGLRYDYVSITKKGNMAPRISFSYYLMPDISNINFSYGEYYQSFTTEYFDSKNLGINKDLNSSHSRHFIIGYEHILSPGLKLTLEAYYKNNDNLLIDSTFINSDNRMYRQNSELAYTNDGKSQTYGFEILLQQKLVDDLYGTLSLSKMYSKYKAPKNIFDANYNVIDTKTYEYSSAYEYPTMFTLIVGKRFKALRNEMNDLPFYIRYPLYILPFSNDMEISMKYRYTSGNTYTPMYYTTNEQTQINYNGEIKWHDGSWFSKASEVNSARMKYYQRFDLEFTSRFHMDKWSISVYISLQNVFNTKNEVGYSYNSDGTYDKVYGFSFMPVGGFEIEF